MTNWASTINCDLQISGEMGCTTNENLASTKTIIPMSIDGSKNVAKVYVENRKAHIIVEHKKAGRKSASNTYSDF